MFINISISLLRWLISWIVCGPLKNTYQNLCHDCREYKSNVFWNIATDYTYRLMVCKQKVSVTPSRPKWIWFAPLRSDTTLCCDLLHTNDARSRARTNAVKHVNMSVPIRYLAMFQCIKPFLIGYNKRNQTVCKLWPSAP